MNEGMNKWHIKLCVMVWMCVGGGTTLTLSVFIPTCRTLLIRLGSLQKVGPRMEKVGHWQWTFEGYTCALLHPTASLLPANTIWTELFLAPAARPSLPRWTEVFLKSWVKTIGWRDGSVGHSACVKILNSDPSAQVRSWARLHKHPSAVVDRDQRIVGACWPPT